MNIIVVSDIFGKTPALTTLAEDIGAMMIIDPYKGVDMGFENESKAYAYFVEQVGFEQYVSIVKQALRQQTDAMQSLVGFSIGAAAIWALSDAPEITNVHRGIGYYGSQIRNFTTVTPRFDIDLLFPEKEDHFDVLALQAELSQKKKVKITQTNYLHGFMNVHSTHYHEKAYREHLQWLQETLVY